MSTVQNSPSGVGASGVSRVRRPRGLHSKNVAISFPEKVTIEEVRRDPAYYDQIEEYLRAVDRKLVPFMRNAVHRVPDIECLRDGVAAQIRTGGKRLRAAMCVLSCEMFGVMYERALDYAAAIEHIQNFTLIHDDIEDGDDERRSLPALWKKYGVPHAINIGDTFVPLATMSILSSGYSPQVKLRLMETIAHCGLEMASGQALDINLRSREFISVSDYITCTKNKTGSFLAMAVVGGGIIGGATPVQLAALRDYARSAGVAFQIKDDSLDFTGTKGREIGSDIREGKITAHAVYAINNASVEDRARLRNILRKSRNATTARDIAWVVELYKRTGAIQFAQRTSISMIEASLHHLLKLPPSESREKLIMMSRYLSRRLR
jgi:geranylgeranyl diphosphate synthase type I